MIRRLLVANRSEIAIRVFRALNELGITSVAVYSKEDKYAMFRTLAEEGINIQMISTSEIKISVAIDEKYLELAVRVLHRAFGLDQAAA